MRNLVDDTKQIDAILVLQDWKIACETRKRHAIDAYSFKSVLRDFVTNAGRRAYVVPPDVMAHHGEYYDQLIRDTRKYFDELQSEKQQRALTENELKAEISRGKQRERMLSQQIRILQMLMNKLETAAPPPTKEEVESEKVAKLMEENWKLHTRLNEQRLGDNND